MEAGEEWQPSEFAKGMGRFKDPGVYVDGQLMGILSFGELPVPLEPFWYEEEASLEFRKGQKGPKTKTVRQRRYRLYDYLVAVGVDVGTVREVHVHGGGRRRAMTIVSGENLRNRKDELLFRFGGSVFGKPLANCPADLGDKKCPDQITAIAVYAQKAPPVRVGNDLLLNGAPVDGLAYYGAPLRGGVRVYVNNRLGTVIKRRLLADGTVKIPSYSGKWKFFEFLAAKGIDSTGIVEGWVIFHNKRVKRFSKNELLSAMIEATEQGKGKMKIAGLEAQAIALHSEPLNPEAMPVLTEEEKE